MTIVQLEYLVAVANYGSFSVASERCLVTQPSLSMQIKNLEDELGVILLDRSKKPVIPTEAGAVVIRNAREAIKSYNYIRESVSEFKGEISGTLRLGMIPTVAPYLIPRFLPDFMRRYPKVELELHEMLTGSIIKALNHDQLDAAILAGGTSPDNMLEQELFNDRFYAYVSPKHRLYERTHIRIEDVRNRDLVLLCEGNCLRDQIVELCHLRPATHRNALFHCGSLDTLMRIVDVTATMTILPKITMPFVPQEHQSQIKTFAKGDASRKIVLTVRRAYVKGSLVNALRESILRNH